MSLIDDTLREAEKEEGELLLWILVWSELAIFGALLTGFMVMSLLRPEAFAAARQHLSSGFAALNTVILLSSGWQAALAARRRTTPLLARRPLICAALLGVAFVGVKIVEYSGEIGFTGTEVALALFELYFLITGFHLLHVLFGAFILLLIAWRPSQDNIHLMTTLWHAIDLIWLVMFPIIYLA
ncbi:cytochrome c oxidase subunit 3 [Rhodomicrobium udaipurense]|uniref:Cytochrome c oxidase subunit 3 n=1 Tax=Rhodomicrobium udaipurense TaxID=1202716 RepID=A0A8I1GE08_9HYPH|nr:cytochrome c oxidase subunit 3 [Rhodomicrobium udaipurense]